MAAESIVAARGWVRHSGWYDLIMGYHTPVISEGRRYTWQGGRCIPGLTSVMGHQLLVERRKRGKRIRLKRTGIRGAQLGSLVHRQIEDWVLHDAAGFRARHPKGPHAYTTRAMDEMVRVRGWQPIRAEYVVHDPQVNMATRIDVICLKRDGTPVFVELKTQYEGGAFDAQDPDKRWRCSGPLRGCSCTPADQAAVQITLGVIMALRVFREQVWPDPVKLRALELDRVEAYVLWVTDTHVQVRRVPTDMMGHVGLAVWRHLLSQPADKEAEVTVV